MIDSFFDLPSFQNGGEDFENKPCVICNKKLEKDKPIYILGRVVPDEDGKDKGIGMHIECWKLYASTEFIDKEDR